MKQTILLFMTVLLATGAYAQSGTTLSGTVVDAGTGEPVQGVTVILRGALLSETSDVRGGFEFTHLTPGEETIALSSPEIISREFRIRIEAGDNTLDDIRVVVIPDQNQAYAGIVDEVAFEGDMDGSGSQEISTMVILSNDVYLNTVNWQLSPLRFRIRGYDSRYEQKYINGVEFNEQYRGTFNYSAIGALNDLTRNGDNLLYNEAGMFSYGSIGGVQNINMRAGSYTPGMRVTATYTNRNHYYLRGMATYSTGLRDDGWAFSMSVGGRWSDEGYVKGTFYNNFAYGIAIEKQLDGGRHSISFTTFGSPVKRGQQSASIQEVYDLVGDNLYNPNWGYQNGKKRNSRVVNSYDPTGILSHVWKIKDDMTLTTGLGVHYKRYGRTSLNWYNAADPRPDYYRDLPSYFDDPYTKEIYTEKWQSGDPTVTQIDWDLLYERNAQQTEGNALYMIEEQREDLFEGSFNSTFNAVVNDRYRINAGVGARYSRTYLFKTVDDLMGANWLLDIDKYAERDANAGTNDKQNDLNRPNRVVYEGDKFGYNLSIDIKSANVWMDHKYTGRLVDVSYSTKLSYTEFQRYGKMRNGHYPDNSYGWGKAHKFVDYGMKAGALFKITGRHFISANIGWETEAPVPYEAYTSVTITDKTPGNLKSAGIFNFDLNYVFSLPQVHGRVSVYNTNFFDRMIRKSYYNDSQGTFVNNITTGARIVHRGIEAGATYKINGNWSVDVAGTWAQYYYANNPTSVISWENNLAEDVYETTYIRNNYTGQTPQLAGTIGLNYFYNYWFVNLNVNGFSQTYIDINPARRLASNYTSVNPYDPDEMAGFMHLTSQERFAGGCTVDISIGKMLYLKNRRSMNFNLSVNNLFNRENIKTGGYEQGRVSVQYAERFGHKYFYMQGINCFANVSYRF